MDGLLQKVEAEHAHTQEVRYCSAEASINLERQPSFSICKPVSFPYSVCALNLLQFNTICRESDPYLVAWLFAC